MTKTEITIRVDTNDGDYNEVTNPISKEDLNKLKPLFKAIKQFKPYKAKGHGHAHNFPMGEILREDLGEKSPAEIYNVDEELIELLEEYLPHCDYGFHTIERVEIFPQPKKERLL